MYRKSHLLPLPCSGTHVHIRPTSTGDRGQKNKDKNDIQRNEGYQIKPSLMLTHPYTHTLHPQGTENTRTDIKMTDEGKEDTKN